MGELDFKFGTFVMTNKKPVDPNRDNKTPAGLSRMREKSAGAKLDLHDKRLGLYKTEQDANMPSNGYSVPGFGMVGMSASKGLGNAIIGYTPKDSSPRGQQRGNLAGQSYTNGFQSNHIGYTGIGATSSKRGQSSNAQAALNQNQDKFYTSFYEGGAHPSPLRGMGDSQMTGWNKANPNRPTFTVKTSDTPTGYPAKTVLNSNKSASSLLSNSIQVKTLNPGQTGTKFRPSNTSPSGGSGITGAGLTMTRGFTMSPMLTATQSGGGGPSSSGPKNSQKAHPRFIPKLDPPRTSTASFHVIKSYSVNTCKGLVRAYNEDRVSIILNMLKPEDKKCKKWPVCSFFGVFDGHGGSACSDFLRDHLHRFIIEDPAFPDNVPQAIHQGFLRADEEFLRSASSRISEIEVSGSCACILLIVDEKGYIGNSGDSRAIMSLGGGLRTQTLSNDHKPNFPPERQRIESSGGSVYK